MRRTSPVAKGFTIIEMLIVVTVVAILATLLFPVLAATREKARSIVCQSHLRQMGQACWMYANDWDGYLPSTVAWQWQVYDAYITARQIFDCPSFDHRFTPLGYGNYPPQGAGAYNMNVLKNNNDSGPHESEFQDPAGTVWIHDGSGGVTVHAGPYGFRVSDGLVISEEDLIVHGVSPRHHRGTNVLFVDGHVKWCNLGYLMQYKVWTMEAE